MSEPRAESFLGTWKGQWDGTQDATLVIEKVEDGIAHYSYRAEPTEAWGVKEPVETSGTTKIEDRTLKIGDVLTFMYVDDTRLDGKMTVDKFTNLGAFIKS